ncbi:MAG TPA: hypothetical protein VFI37_02580 [Gaiellaceae bacterium]|jgi:hypothetical protein|nr:hypothetical protein [Gaiellaceae bacterium]
MRPTSIFGRHSPVLAYWLAHSEGFRVESPSGCGVVERVFSEPGEHRVTALAVRGRLPARRRQILPVHVFRAVDPAERVLVAERPLAHVDLGDAVRGFTSVIDGDAIAAWLGRLKTAAAAARTASSPISSRDGGANDNGNGRRESRTGSGSRSSSSRSS